jgi:hypothetical protein
MNAESPAPSGHEEINNEYAHLLDPDAPSSEDMTTAEIQARIESAAVRPSEEGATELSAEDAARIDAALRERKEQPQLSDDQIAKIRASRDGELSQADIDGINAARKNGIDMSH